MRVSRKGYLAHRNNNGETTERRNRHQNNNKIVRNQEERNVGNEGEKEETEAPKGTLDVGNFAVVVYEICTYCEQEEY